MASAVAQGRIFVVSIVHANNISMNRHCSYGDMCPNATMILIIESLACCECAIHYA